MEPTPPVEVYAGTITSTGEAVSTPAHVPAASDEEA
jgi:hypothetical protein